MSVTPYPIAAYETGLQNDVEPWLIPEEAFPLIEDAYIQYKRVKRRHGNIFLARLVAKTSQTYAGAVSNVAVSFSNSGTPLTNVEVEPHSVTVTINALTFTDDGSGNMLNAALAIVGAINYFTGVFNVTFPAIGGAGPYNVVVAYSYYPARPVMGLREWEQSAINQEGLIAFDTVKANVFNPATGFFDDISFYNTSLAPISWTGTDSQFFATENYQGAFFATNNKTGYHVQQVTNVTVGATTVITFAANSIGIGETVFITGIVGTAGALLNDLNFVTIGSTGVSITVNVNTVALAYVSGGTVWAFEETTSGDGIRWYANDGQVNGWVNFSPPITPTSALKGARMLISYKGYLIALSTWEGSIASTDVVNYTNRARWSRLGTPFFSNPVPINQTFDVQSWRSDIPGKGGVEDAATQEAIVSAEFIRDTLIVFFERSSWALRFTGNTAFPFIWVRINIEFGCESQFSIIPFDRGILAIGDRGIITADGNNVTRIDAKIPRKVFEFQNKDQGPARVYGIRDYFNELAYWTYVSPATISTGAVYPNRVLVYNYREGSWAIFKDSWTCYGYYQSVNSLLWNNAAINWEDAAFLWNAEPSQSQFKSIVAGTPTGYVSILSDTIANQKTISITGITKALQAVVTTKGPHNLDTNSPDNPSYIKIQDVAGMTQINNLNTAIEVITSTTFRCLNIDSTAFSSYTYGGDITRINGFNIFTKQLNPFVSTGKRVLMKNIDFYTNYVLNGRVTVNVCVDNNISSPVNAGSSFWQRVLPLDQTVNSLHVDKVWTRFLSHARGQFIQIQMTLSAAELLDDETNRVDFVLHAMVPYFGQTGRLIGQ